MKRGIKKFHVVTKKLNIMNTVKWSVTELTFNLDRFFTFLFPPDVAFDVFLFYVINADLIVMRKKVCIRIQSQR